eukprot:scaffold2478_cov136-Skeletonema_menzelii.AAC.1
MDFERKEKNLQEQLDDAQEQLIIAKQKHRNTGEVEDSYLQKTRELKNRIRELQEEDDIKSAKLREVEKSKQRTIQQKEDECLEKIRQLKKEYEEKLQNKDDESFQEMREFKKKTLDGSINDDVNKMIEEKENAFKAEVAKLTAEIETLRQELSDEGNDLEARLLESKSDLKSQSRKYRSEINKLKNTLEMQKSKEARLDGHIKTLEKQIMDMTADYEERIQEYLYGNVDTE